MELAAEKNTTQYLVVPHCGNMQEVAKEIGLKSCVVHFYGWLKKINTSHFDSGFLRRKLRNFIAVLQLSQLILKLNVTVVFTNTSTMSVGAWAAKLTGRKHFWYVHELGEEDFEITFQRGLKSVGFMNRFSVQLFANSEYLLKKYQRLLPGINMSVIRNPVLIERPEQNVKIEKKNSLQLLMLGQVANSKGQHIAVEAIKILIEQGYRLQLNITGSSNDAVYLQSLHRMLDESALQKVVVFKTFTDSPVRTLLESDVLLMCSQCEAYGRVTVEAMKMGIPVIVSNTCGSAEIISDKKNGLVFEQGNSFSLAEKIKLIIIDEALKNKIITGGFLRAKEISGSQDFLAFLKSIYTD